jgi:hypothetical protein
MSNVARNSQWFNILVPSSFLMRKAIIALLEEGLSLRGNYYSLLDTGVASTPFQYLVE